MVLSALRTTLMIVAYNRKCMGAPIYACMQERDSEAFVPIAIYSAYAHH